MEEYKTVRINRAIFELNKAALNRDFDFVHIKIRNYGDFSLAWDSVLKTDFLAIAFVRKSEYVLLFKKGSFLNDFDDKYIISKKSRIGSSINEKLFYDNNIVQLFLNQLAGDSELLPEKNDTVNLLIHRVDWKKEFKDGTKQIYALKIGMNWKNEITANVVTLTQENKREKNSELFYVNNERRILQRNFLNKRSVLYRKRNPAKNNLIDFLLLDGVSDFERSKVGIIDKLLENLNAHFGEYFVNGITLKDSKIIAQNSNKPLFDEKNIWDFFKNQRINLFFNKNDEMLQELASRLMQNFEKSEIFKAKNIVVKNSNSSKRGLNLQLIRDVRKDSSEIELYELGIREKVIQHLTPDGFGKMDYQKKEIRWNVSSKKSDIAMDPAIINVFQNLAIKWDLQEEKMNLIVPNLLKVTSNYNFFFLDFSKNRDTIVIVKLNVSSNGDLTYTAVTADRKNPRLDNELSKIWSYILEKEKSREFLLREIECIMEIQGDYILILQTEMQIFPIHEEISKREKNADGNRLLNLSEVIKNLQFLKMNLKDKGLVKKYTKNEIQLMIDCVTSINLPKIKIKDINETLKKDDNISFRKASYRQICIDLENNFGYTFNNSTRQSKPVTLFPGFKGMGIIQEPDGYYYYVGKNTNPKQKISKAIRLRKIVPLTGNDEKIISFFSDLTKLMSVTFVRNGQFTVLPYPIKYLREFLDYQGRLSEMNEKADAKGDL